MRLQYLTGENIIFKMRLGWCIRMLLQYLTSEPTIINDFRVVSMELQYLIGDKTRL